MEAEIDVFILAGALLSTFTVPILLPKPNCKLQRWARRWSLYLGEEKMGFAWTSENSRKLGRKDLFRSYAHLAKPSQTNQANKTVPGDSLVKRSRSQSSGFLSNRPSNSALLCPADFQKFGWTWNQFLFPLWPLQSLLFTAGLTPALST